MDETTGTGFFFRDGRPAIPNTTSKGKPAVLVTPKCYRCGGAGGAQKWAPTGWTCFACGGTGHAATKAVRVYTPAENAKLDLAASKREAKRMAAAEAKRAAEAAAAEAKRADFLATHGALITRAEAVATEGSFIRSLLTSIYSRYSVTERQLECLTDATAKAEAEAARRAAASYVGVVGERLDADVIISRAILIASDHHLYGNRYLHVLRTEGGSTLIYFGRLVGGEGSKYHVRATVREHKPNRKTGEPETIIFRPKWTLVEAA